MIQKKIKKARGLFTALRYVPPSRVFARIRRDRRTRQLLANPAMMAFKAISSEELVEVTARLAAPAFAQGAQRVTELTLSSFAFDRVSETLHFLASGDTVDLGEIENIAWTTPKKIPASDVNRCFFISFAEQATLLSGDPQIDLDALSSYIQRLVSAAPVGGSALPIPWHPLTAARRLINVLSALSLILAAEPSLAVTQAAATLTEHARALDWLVDYVREDDLAYNHLATEIFAQCLSAYVFAGPAQFESRLIEFLDCMGGQTGGDGFQLERSATYQAHLLGHLEVLLAGGIVPHPIRGRLESLANRMRDALAIVTHPDGGIAVLNDAAVGDGPSPESLHAWPRTWQDGITHLRDAGYARLQAGVLAAIFDAGRCGPDDNPGHAHADFLSFELSVDKARLIVDPGVASYKGGPERDWTRSAASHNGPTFASLEPIEFIGPFRVGRRGTARFFGDGEVGDFGAPVFTCGWQNGFDPFEGRVARWLGLWPDRAAVVVDVWRGREDLNASSSFLVPASWTVISATTARVDLVSSQTQRVSLVALSGTFDFDPSAVYHLCGARNSQPALRITLRPAGNGAERMASLAIQLHPQSEGSKLPEIETLRVADALLIALKRQA